MASNDPYRNHFRPELREASPAPVDGFANANLDDAKLAKAAKADLTVLHQFANDGRPQARRNAWRAIAARGKLDSYTTLLAAVALRDDDDEVRILAAQALHGALPDEMPSAIAALLRLRAADPKEAIKVAVVAALHANAAGFVAQMPDLFDARDDRVAAAIVATCGELGAKVVGEAVRAGVRHAGPVHRDVAIAALCRLGAAEVDKSFADLVATLAEPYDPARVGALRALALVPKRVAKDSTLVERVMVMRDDDGSYIVRRAAGDLAASLATAR